MLSKRFVHEDENINTANPLVNIPRDVRYIIYSLLSVEDIVALGSAGTFFYREINSTLASKIWNLAFTRLNYDEKLIKELIKLNAVVNYFNLYRVLSHLSKSMRENINAVWQLLCISGEPTAIDIGIKKNIITLNERNRNKDNILYYAALSGVPDQLDKVINLNEGINPETQAENFIPLNVTFGYLNIFHFAILSGKHEQIEKVFDLEKKYNFILERNVTKRNRTPLHMAVVSGFPEQVKAIREIFGTEFDNVKDNTGRIPIEYAETQKIKEEMQSILMTHNNRPK